MGFVSFQVVNLLEFTYINWIGWFFMRKSDKVSSSTVKAHQPLNSQDGKYLLFSWIKNRPNLNLSYYQKLFPTTSLGGANQSLVHLDFKNLYLILLNLTTRLPNFYKGESKSLGNSSKFFKFELHSLATSFTNYQNKSSLVFLNKKDNWSYLPKVADDVVGDLLKKKGLFYRTNLTASDYSNLLFPKNKVYSQDEFFSINSFHFKTMRFLYNYSFLHRKVFNDSHKITMTKKLLSSGFYNDQLFKKNIWVSDLFNSSKNSHKLLKTELELNYGKLFKSQLPTSRLSNIDKLNTMDFTLKSLSFYESSFIWFIKRLQNLTLLKSQKTLISWNPQPLSKFNNQKKFSATTLTDFTKSNSFLNFFLNYEPLLGKDLDFSLPQKFTTTPLKGLKLSTFDFDLLTQEDESILIEFVGNAGGQENAFTFWYKTQDVNLIDMDTLKKLPDSKNNSDSKNNKLFSVYFLHKTLTLDLINFFKVTA